MVGQLPAMWPLLVNWPHMGAAQGGVVGEKAGVVYAPHEFLLVGELGVGECGVFFVECALKWYFFCGIGNNHAKVSTH
jgi:hypothetical protein